MGADQRGRDIEDFHRKRGKIAENWTLTDVSRRYFGVDGRFSAVSRRQCRRFTAKTGPGNLHLTNPRNRKGTTRDCVTKI